jgi:hypothetical protein
MVVFPVCERWICRAGNYQCPSCCYQSWSIFQTKVVYNWQSWPMLVNSTAFAADYHFASMRSCMEGDLAGYFAGRSGNNGHTYSRDIAGGDRSTIMWGCLGFHYSGNWYDGNSSSGAIWYITWHKRLCRRSHRRPVGLQ